jgi:peptide/nickel transport system ATP-binding protein
MSPPIIKGRGINVVFGRGGEAFHAVKDVDFDAFPGEAVGVVGESGSGKTTLARVLVGLQPPTSGSVLVEGREVYENGVMRAVTADAPWRLQMIFQDPYSSLNPRLTALSAVSEAVHVWQGTGRSESNTRALQLINAMGLSAEQARQFPRSLSGGQRQRVSVARALAPEPAILVADEPTSAIDQSAQAQLLNLFRRLQTERKLTIVFISHDLNLVRYLTSRVYVMQRGVVVEHGETQRVFASPEHPYTRELIDAIPRRKDSA